MCPKWQKKNNDYMSHIRLVICIHCILVRGQKGGGGEGRVVVMNNRPNERRLGRCMCLLCQSGVSDWSVRLGRVVNNEPNEVDWVHYMCWPCNSGVQEGRWW
jgi:hypothetical protein